MIMADEEVQDQTAQDDTEEKAITLEQVMAELENVKKAQAGSDKKYQETAKKLKDAEAALEKEKLEKMTEKEKAEHLLAEKEKDLEIKEREVINATLHFSTAKALSEKGMDAAFADFVMAESEDAVTEKIGKLEELINKQVGKRVNETLSMGNPPKTGGSAEVKKTLPTDLIELEKIFRARQP